MLQLDAKSALIFEHTCRKAQLRKRRLIGVFSLPDISIRAVGRWLTRAGGTAYTIEKPRMLCPTAGLLLKQVSAYSGGANNLSRG